MRRLILLVMLVVTIIVVSHPKTQEVKVVKKTWTVQDSKSYARDVVMAWQANQFRCLDKLWTKESNWRSDAYNKVKVMGKNAGGIPQILGLDPKLPAPLQIDRGFAYIMHRYGTPCMAWKFHQRKGWY